MLKKMIVNGLLKAAEKVDSIDFDDIKEKALAKVKDNPISQAVKVYKESKAEFINHIKKMEELPREEQFELGYSIHKPKKLADVWKIANQFAEKEETK